MKILLIMTGGTICSRMTGTTLDSDTGYAVPLLVDRLKNDGFEAEFEVVQIMNTLSENMTPRRYDLLLDYFRSLGKDKLRNLDGVIIAHGTDTLAYTSSLIAVALAGFELPVFIVSSNHTLDRPEANGHANFRAACELIKRGFGRGVYVPYRNSDGIVYLHRGGQLIQCANFSSDFFSRDMLPFTNTRSHSDACSYAVARPYESDCAEMPLIRMKRPLGGVLMLTPYVGLDYSKISIDGIGAVLQRSYHSYTACVDKQPDGSASEYSALTLLERCKAAGIGFWLGGVPETEGLTSGTYSTTAELIRAGARPVYALTDETAYAKLMVASSMGLGLDETDEFLRRELAGEKIMLM